MLSKSPWMRIFNLCLKHFVLFLICIQLIVVLFQPAKAQSNTAVRIDPSNFAILVGEQETVAIKINAVDNMYGFEIHLHFDPSKVHIIDSDDSLPGVQMIPGDIFDPSQGFLVANEADNVVGQMIFAFTLLSPAKPISGDGTLIEFELVGIELGMSDLKLDEVILASPDGLPLSFDTKDGIVNIETQMGVSYTPTLTPIPAASLVKSVTPTSTPLISEKTTSIPVTGTSVATMMLTSSQMLMPPTSALAQPTRMTLSASKFLIETQVEKVVTTTPITTKQIEVSLQENEQTDKGLRNYVLVFLGLIIIFSLVIFVIILRKISNRG